mgnify:CR=1 FL=1
MQRFVASQYQKLLREHDLDDFEGLWNLELDTVDTPNTERGGWSSVCRLELEVNGEKSAFYLKRQCNHQSLSWQRPFGEPTFARELRNINAYAKADVAALEAVFYGERSSEEGRQAILLTVALDEYLPLSDALPNWNNYDAELRAGWCRDIGLSIARLHNACLTHHCLYPKHLYLLPEPDVSKDPIRFIDLEKTRYQILRWRDRVADLEALLRRCDMWTAEERMRLLETYLSELNQSKSLSELQSLMDRRRANKAARS